MSTHAGVHSLAAAISFSLAAGALHAATITVDSADDSPASTYCNLRNALQAIKDGSTTSVPACSGAVSGEAFGTNDTVTFAEFLAGATITLSQGSISLTASAVTINGSGQTIDAGGQGAVIDSGPNLTFSASHLYLTGGSNAASGGGVVVGSGSTAEFADCTISGNSTNGVGGGLYAGPAASVRLTDSTVSGNTGNNGGGIFANSASVYVTNSVIAYNTARYSGGAIYSFGAPLELDIATIKQNTAQTLSGGIVSISGTVDAAHSAITGNKSGRTGGLFASASNGTIATSTISGNTSTCASSCSGAIYLLDASFTISRSTVSGNLAAGRVDSVSGGVLAVNGTTTFLNSTLSGNIGVGNGQVGGAAWEFQTNGGGFAFVNSTVSDNTAFAFYGKAAGGVLLGSVYLSPMPPINEKLTLANTIIAANTPADSDLAWDPYGSTLSAAYSMLGSAQDVAEFNDPSDHNIFTDSPGLDSLRDNGGPTRTQALLPDSPALRAGSRALASYAGQPVNYDQRGSSFLRVFGDSVDIGAFQDQGDRPFANGFEPEP
jgi:hypothetical protein